MYFLTFVIVFENVNQSRGRLMDNSIKVKKYTRLTNNTKKTKSNIFRPCSIERNTMCPRISLPQYDNVGQTRVISKHNRLCEPNVEIAEGVLF